MSDPAFPLAEYLARIAYDGPLAPTAATLAALHRHQLFAIPFENLDPLAGRPPSLAPAALAEKLIRQHRGGYCFELNGLFLLALHALGFRSRTLCARVLLSPDNYGPRTHQITLVEFTEGPWLADVGYGGNGLVDPIPLQTGAEFTQSHNRFRLCADPTYGFRLEHLLPDGWRTNYAFSLDPFLPADFHALNYFIGHSPDSIFTRVPICVRTTPAGRRIIVADQFKVRPIDGPATATTLETTAQLRTVLADQFDLALPADFPLPAPSPAPPGLREV